MIDREIEYAVARLDKELWWLSESAGINRRGVGEEGAPQ